VGGGGGTTTTTVCTGLSDRLDKITTRLDGLQTSLTSIEKKIDIIVNEIAKQKADEQLDQIITRAVNKTLLQVTADRQKQNQTLARVFRILQQKDTDRSDQDKKDLESLLLQLEK
jgi:hypothetical protein